MVKIKTGHIDRWLLRFNFALETKRVYRRAAFSFVTEVKPNTKRWVERAVKWHDQQDLGQASKQLYLVAARMFLTWCLQEKLVDENPLVGVRIRISEFSAPRPVLMVQQVKSVLSLIRAGDSEVDRRDYAVIMLMLHTALRVGGAASIDIEDFKRSGSRVLASYRAKGHGGKDSFVVVPPTALKAIELYLSSQEPPRALFKSRGALFTACGRLRRLAVSSMRKIVTRRLRQAGVQDAVVHSLRHTAATMALEAGVDILKIKDMLGHANLNTTQLYLHTLKRIEEAAELEIDYGLEKEEEQT